MSTEVNTALKGFHHARLSCGCRITFRAGVAGSPVLAVVERKASSCTLTFHVEGLAVYDRVGGACQDFSGGGGACHQSPGVGGAHPLPTPGLAVGCVCVGGWLSYGALDLKWF